MNEKVEFKINFYMEIDFKDMPKEFAEKLTELITKLKQKEFKNRKTRIDVEEIKQ